MLLQCSVIKGFIYKSSVLLAIIIASVNLSNSEILSNPNFDDSKYTCGSELETETRSNLHDLRLWPRGILKVHFDTSFSQTHLGNFFVAIREFGRKTCIGFNEWNRKDPDYIHVYQTWSNDSHCGSASICYSGRKQNLQIRWDCSHPQYMVHEILHSLCLIHEHQRIDRNQYLSFATCNNPSSIPPIEYYQRDVGNLYDYASQLHYPCVNCFGRPTVPGAEYCGSQINSEGLSVLDADKVNSYYNCQGCHRHRWLSVKTLTAAQMGQLVDFAAYPGDREPIYVCRAYGYEGEIAPGRFRPTEKICQISWRGKTWNMSGNMEVFALPNGYNKITATTRGYRLIKGILDTKEWVAVGRTNWNKNIYLAVADDDSEGELKTYVGQLYQDAAAYFSHPLKGELVVRFGNYSVVMCESK